MSKPGKKAKKPAHKRYVEENRRLKKVQRNVLRSSHGKWNYDELVKHQKKVKEK